MIYNIFLNIKKYIDIGNKSFTISKTFISYVLMFMIDTCKDNDDRFCDELFLKKYLQDLLNDRIFSSELTQEDLSFLDYMDFIDPMFWTGFQALIYNLLSGISDSISDNKKLSFLDILNNLDNFQEISNRLLGMLNNPSQLNLQFRNIINRDNYKLTFLDHIIYYLIKKIKKTDRNSTQKEIFNFLESRINTYKPNKNIGDLVNGVIGLTDKIILFGLKKQSKII